MRLTADRDGERADQLLARGVGDLSRSQAQKLLDEGRVTCGGRVLRKNDRLRAGDELLFTLPEVRPATLQAEDIPLDVRYEDGDVIVINKPKGLVVHPAAGHWEGTLVSALLHHCAGSLSGIGGELRPGIVHRIDKDTSGLLICAKNDFAHQALAAQLQDHTLCRIYEAVACGRVREDAGVIDLPIGRSRSDRKKMAVNGLNAKRAVTHFTVLARYSGYTHLRLQLETGRTHQIRVHLAARSHPVLADPVYGRAPQLGLDSQCLHARELRFLHPRSGEEVRVFCDLPEYFREILQKLGQPLD